MKKLIFLLSVLMITACCQKKSCVENGVVTKLQVANNTPDTVLTYLTLGAGNQNVSNVTGIFGITDSGLVGSFLLMPYDTVTYNGCDSLVISGNITFFTQPVNCANAILYPNGINLFEFSLNNRCIDTTQQETIDISHVAGVNALGSFAMKGGGKWNASSAYPDVNFFFNDSLYKNYGKVGIYPYGCTNCTSISNPPVCPDAKPFAKPQSQPICNVQRSCMSSGGVVTIGFGAILIMR